MAFYTNGKQFVFAEQKAEATTKKKKTGMSRQYRMQSTSSYDLGLKFTYLNWNRESVGSNRERMNVQR